MRGEIGKYNSEDVCTMETIASIILPRFVKSTARKQYVQEIFFHLAGHSAKTKYR